jgi:hypothetical protein
MSADWVLLFFVISLFASLREKQNVGSTDSNRYYLIFDISSLSLRPTFKIKAKLLLTMPKLLTKTNLWIMSS